MAEHNAVGCGVWAVARNKDVQMPCLLQRGSPAAASLWMFDSGFGGRPLQWSPCNTDSISCAGKSKGCPCWAFRECWLLRRPEQCYPGLAGVWLWDKSSGRFWVAFLQKSLCWLSKCRESFTVLEWELGQAPLVRNGPASSAPARPMAEGYGGKGHWLFPGSCVSRDIFISLGFVPPSLTVEYGVVPVCLFCFHRG